jgi:hypothetical protein
VPVIYGGYVEVIQLASGQRAVVREVYTKGATLAIVQRLGLCREIKRKVDTDSGWKYKTFSNGGRWPQVEWEWCPV